MTAIDELCQLLDERNEEYERRGKSGCLSFHEWVGWYFNLADRAYFYEYSDGSTKLVTYRYVYNLTPEQAIEATLGSCNCTNSERTSDELLPCPFCGGEARIITAAGESWVLCDECKATTEAHTSRQTAIAAWNRRADG